MKLPARALTIFLLTVAICFATAAPKKKQSAEPEAAPETETAERQDVTEFQGDEVGLVLRALAREAGVNVVIDSSVSGTVTMRLLKRTARQAIDVIIESKELLAETKDGVIYISAKHPVPDGAKAANYSPLSPLISPSSDKPIAQQISEALDGPLKEIFTKTSDTHLDYMARAETAQKIAKAEKKLYDALIQEGFSKEDAMRILLKTPVLSSAGFPK